MPRSARPLAGWAAALAAYLATATSAWGLDDLLPRKGRDRVDDLNKTLAGKVVDFTANHGPDRRVYSPALDDHRDLYVYLPPGYDHKTPFPVVLWLHGVGHDEKNFLDVAPVFDEGIRTGKFPPVVIAAPDGSLRGRQTLVNVGSFYLNGKNGDYEGSVARDVWSFVKANFAVRPERDAHVIAGASMGGFGAFNLGFKYRDEFGHIAGIMPPLNLRYGDRTGKYLAPYDPEWTFRETNGRTEAVGRFYGIIVVRSHRLLDPVAGRHNPDPTAFVSAENPTEMLTAYDVKPGEFGMFVGYGTKDEFNIGPQVRSFVDVAAKRGITPEIVVVPDGRHNFKTAVAMFPAFSAWMTGRLAAYVPPGYAPPAAPAPVHTSRRPLIKLGRP